LRVERALVADAARLVTVTGPGGIGKSRFANEAARRLWPAFGGRVAFVLLAEVQAAPMIVDAMARILGIEQRGADALLDRVVAALSGPERRLLVLDNFEHLVESGASVVRELIARVPSLSCLVTSRRVLALSAEREVALTSLAVPGDCTAEELALLPSVRLLADRARVVRPDFTITAANAKDVAELVRRLEGIPLALVLAAVRLHVLSPAQVLEKVTRWLDVESRQQDVPARHKTLRAAFDSSYELLRPEPQALFAKLSVFAGSFELEAVEAIAEEPLALDHLADLVEGSLVQVESVGNEVRYRLLETIRDYAREWLSENERSRLRERHAEHYSALAERTAEIYRRALGGA
jgi:predicted ATPase